MRRRSRWGWRSGWVLGLTIVLAGVASGQTRELHVAPAGDDRGPGSTERPLATLGAALARVGEAAAPAEIVLHAGEYARVQIGERSQRTGPARPRLVVRAARRADGSFEDVRFAADAAVARAEAVVGAAGLYRVRAPWPGNDEPQMWERERRTRYALVADLEAVKRYPASFTVGEGFFWFHTSDGQAPGGQGVERSQERSGIVVWRSDVTLQGLRVVGGNVAGIAARGQRTIVEDCRVENARMGVSVDGDGSVVRRLRVDDSGGGVYVAGADVVVEDSRVFKRSDDFAYPTYAQDDTGVQFYYPAQRGVARGNLVVGFENCVFVKTRGGARIERNTCVAPRHGAFGVGSGWAYPETAVRDNLVVGFNWPVTLYESVRPGTVVAGNCFAESRNEHTLKKTLEHLGRVGAGRNHALERVRFAAPEDEDYRVVGGPCAGALPALAPGEPVPGAPQVEISLEGPARPAADGLAYYVERDPRLGGAPARLGPERLPAVVEWLAPAAEVVLRIETDPARRPSRMRLRGCDGTEREEPASERRSVRLGPEGSVCRLGVRVADPGGRWSEPVELLVRHGGGGPRVLGQPHVRASEHGAVVTLESDGPGTLGVEVEPPARVVAQRQRAWIDAAARVSADDLAGRRIVHQVVLAAGGGPGSHRYRITLTDALGRKTTTGWSTVTMAGPARTHHVAPDGRDDEAGGAADAPWRTLQFALDRALPGDRIVLAPGLYPGETIVTHGGTEQAPIVVEAAVRGSAVLDGAKRVDAVVELREAPYVTLDGLEIRWGREEMVRAAKSPGLVVRNGRIWGALWFGRGDATSLDLHESPGAVLDHNVILKCRGILLRKSPGATVTHNTLFANSFSAVAFLRSARGSVCRNNSLAFNGNEVFAFVVESPEELAAFSSDHNNLGSHLQPPKDAWIEKDPRLPERVRGRQNLPLVYAPFASSKAKRLVVVNDKALFSLEEWQAFSGQDAHSLFADPMYVDVERRDFRLAPGSPNLGAGEGGATIGALGAAGR